MKYDFASDNTSGICPEAWEALSRANHGRIPSYGTDDWTTRAADLIRELFETDCEVFFVFNGTAANSLALASLSQSYHSVICHDQAHVERDECGAPEFFSNGTKIIVVDGENGKLDPVQVEQAITRRNDLHYPKPRVISITQSTELGTVYTPEEIGVLAQIAEKYGLSLHMDGARFANAAASLGIPPKNFTWKAGVDVLCFGGTKNGMAIGEAVVFFRKDQAREFEYRCKQAGQLASKMRFLAAQWVGLLENGAWLANGQRANKSARYLANQLSEIPEVRTLFPVEANGVFVEMPSPIAETLQSRGWHFYNFIGDSGYRLMCSWETSNKDVDAFVADLHTSLKQRH